MRSNNHGSKRHSEPVSPSPVAPGRLHGRRLQKREGKRRPPSLSQQSRISTRFSRGAHGAAVLLGTICDYLSYLDCKASCPRAQYQIDMVVSTIARGSTTVMHRYRPSLATAVSGGQGPESHLHVAVPSRWSLTHGAGQSALRTHIAGGAAVVLLCLR